MKSLLLFLSLSIFVFSIGCKKESNPPVINSQSFSINENASSDVIVARVLAIDPDGDNLKFSIPDEGENFPFVFADGTNELKIKSSFVLDYEKQSKYVFRVEVQEQTKEQLSVDAIITIDVLDIKEAPLFKDQTLTIKENLPKGALVGILLFEKENKSQEVEFRIDAGNQNNAFIFDQEGKISINNADEIDFEKSAEFKLSVRISDKSDQTVYTSAIVTIVLEDQVENPNVKDQEFDIEENKVGLYSVGVVNIKSKAPGQEFTFSIVEGNSNGFFFIGPQSGELFVIQGVSFDYEKAKAHTIRVKVQDKQAASLYTNITVLVNVTDQNEVPSILNQNFSVAENSPNNHEIGLIKASDPDTGQKLTFEIVQSSLEGVFKIDSGTGSLRVSDSGKLDYESVKSIDLLIKATDNGDGTLSATANIRVDVLDVDERPVILTKKLQVEENRLPGFVIGKVDAQSYSGSPIECLLVPTTGYEKFSIEKQTGNLVVNQSTVLNYEFQKSYSLIIKVYEKNNTSVFRQETVVVDILDVNEAPFIADQQISIYETTDAGTNIGKVFATDPDAGQTLAYSLTQGNIDGLFAVDSQTGSVSLIKQVTVISGEERSIPLTIRVQDNWGLWTEATLTVVVLKKSIPTNGLVAYFPFNGNANDESFSNNSCSVYGATLGVDRKGRVHSAYSFDGVNDKMVISHSSSLNFDAGKDSYTINMWVKSNNPTNGSLNYGRLFSKWDEYKDDLYPYVILYNSTSCLAQIYHGETNNKSIVSYPNFWDNNWHMISFVVNGETKMICSYLDGSKIECVTNKATLNTKNSLDIIIGYCWPNSVYYKGMIDDITVYNRALSENELNDLYAF